DGLRGDAIHPHARLMAVADSFDAMTSARPYRTALSIDEAARRLRVGAGHQFDRAVIDAFDAAEPELRAGAASRNVPSAVKDDVDEAAVDPDALTALSAIVDVAGAAELVHEEVHARARGADCFGERFLGDLHTVPLWRARTVLREQQQSSGETLLT